MSQTDWKASSPRQAICDVIESVVADLAEDDQVLVLHDVLRFVEKLLHDL